MGLLNQKLKEVKEELDTMKKDCQELVKKYQSVEASRCQEVDDELKVTLLQCRLSHFLNYLGTDIALTFNIVEASGWERKLSEKITLWITL